MAHIQVKTIFGACLLATLTLSSCHSSYHVSQVEGRMIKVDSSWDQNPDQEAQVLLAHYKHTVDSMMNSVIGVSDQHMKKGYPESTLSNLVADVLRDAATPIIGKPADIGIINMGGLRSDLNAGNITRGDVFEVLPFENSLCVITVTGSTLNKLFTFMASKKGEGLSGAELIINSDGELLSATVNQAPIEKDKLYSISTIDYVADGNDGFTSLTNSVHRTCPQDGLLRDLFIRYVERQTLNNKQVTSSLDGRITVK